MPEIAESHIIADELAIFEGKTIIAYNYYDSKYSNLNIVGKKISTVCAIGKRIIFILDEGYLISTLSMTGKWIIPSEWKESKFKLDDIMTYTKVDIIFPNDLMLVFTDVRTWGNLEYYDNIDNELDKLGLDILNGELTMDEWLDILDKKRKKISELLIDQSLIAGIGNYLRAEILYDAKISPMKKSNELTMSEKERLYKSIHNICRIAYENGGLSISNGVGNYISPTGRRGTYKARIYNKKICPMFHTVSRINGNQTVYYCGTCQL